MCLDFKLAVSKATSFWKYVKRELSCPEIRETEEAKCACQQNVYLYIKINEGNNVHRLDGEMWAVYVNILETGDLLVINCEICYKLTCRRTTR